MRTHVIILAAVLFMFENAAADGLYAGLDIGATRQELNFEGRVDSPIDQAGFNYPGNGRMDDHQRSSHGLGMFLGYRSGTFSFEAEFSSLGNYENRILIGTVDKHISATSNTEISVFSVSLIRHMGYGYLKAGLTRYDISVGAQYGFGGELADDPNLATPASAYSQYSTAFYDTRSTNLGYVVGVGVQTRGRTFFRLAYDVYLKAGQVDVTGQTAVYRAHLGIGRYF